MTKEQEFTKRFSAAMAAFKEKFGMEDGGGRFIIVANQPDGENALVQMCGSGCVHESIALAECALDVLMTQAEEADGGCGEADLARN